MKTKELDILHDKIPYLFRNFAIPGILSSLSMCLYGIIDGIILGRYVGPNAMAAVNMASPLFNIISCIAILIAIGGNTLVGISLGRQDTKKANHYFNNASAALFVIAIAIWIAVVFFSDFLSKDGWRKCCLASLCGELHPNICFFCYSYYFQHYLWHLAPIYWQASAVYDR